MCRIEDRVSGFMNMGGNIGGAISPALTPWLAGRFGWIHGDRCGCRHHQYLLSVLVFRECRRAGGTAVSTR
jgi:dipeptide/tripeptide permease